MEQKERYQYYDPYSDVTNCFRRKRVSSYRKLEEDRKQSEQKVTNNQKKQEYIGCGSSARDRRKVIQIKSLSKERKELSPVTYVELASYRMRQEQGKSTSKEHKENPKRNFEICNLKSITNKSKEKQKIVTKYPKKQQKIIKTTVTAPSSIATSILNNFDNNPDQLLQNLSDSKLDKVFLKF